MRIQKTPFGATADGRQTHLYTLTNAAGASVELTDYGCAVRAIRVPDRSGALTDVCMGYRDVSEYEAYDGCAGAVAGRFANRIGGARFTLNGREYRLHDNDHGSCLHGGRIGFDRRVWDAAETAHGVTFTRLSPDGEEGFPGNLSVTAAYEWSDDNVLTLRLSAETDADTVVNLTNHTYFNLSGGGSAMAHMLLIHADSFCEADAYCLATGRIRPVAGTPFDFRAAKPIGRDIGADDVQLKNGGGYDHNFVLGAPGTLREAAVLSSPASGITMTVSTDLPGVQLYTANFLKRRACAYDTVYDYRGAVCLETQFFPNSPACPHFPSTVLRAGERWEYKTVYRF